MVVLVSACGGEVTQEELELGSLKQRLELFQYNATETNTASNTNSATQPIELGVNETVMIGTCGLNGAASDPTNNNVVRLKNPAGVEVTSWGVFSSGCTSFSRVSYTAPAAGVYSIWAGCSSSQSCSGTVSVSKRKGQVTYSALNTNGALLNTYNKQYFFDGGDVIRVSTCTNSSYGASVTSGDTFLRLFKQTSTSTGYTEVALSDNAAGCGTASELTYLVPSAGYYQIRAGCAGNSSCNATFVVYKE
ncbi:hypothetical protein [Stigmatella erecta]|nr:hypothetical protein [Stigmatella erecta]